MPAWHLAGSAAAVCLLVLLAWHGEPPLWARAKLAIFSRLVAAFHNRLAIGRGLVRSPGGTSCPVYGAKPGGSHDGSRETSDMIRIRRLAAGGPPSD